MTEELKWDFEHNEQVMNDIEEQDRMIELENEQRKIKAIAALADQFTVIHRADKERMMKSEKTLLNVLEAIEGLNEKYNFPMTKDNDEARDILRVLHNSLMEV